MGCKVTKTILVIVIAVLALWPSLIGAMASKWIIFAAAIVLLIHDWCCRSCMCCQMCNTEVVKKKSGKK